MNGKRINIFTILYHNISCKTPKYFVMVSLCSIFATKIHLKCVRQNAFHKSKQETGI